MAQGNNPLREIGRIEDLDAEIRTAGVPLDDHLLSKVFIDPLPAKYEVKASNCASRDSIDRDDIIKAVRDRHHRRSRTPPPTFKKEDERVQRWPCRP